ncbi:MAG: HAD-IB family hydrolase [Flavobacteriaceae bacterium]|nr:HAD-IB family hydrolase [Flavobacteriaceae bacterium]
MIKKLYLFDFDGTISSKDSFIHFFIKMIKPKEIISRIFLNLLKIMYLFFCFRNKSKLKEFLISIFLKNKSKAEIERLGIEYNEKYIKKIIREDALDYINKLQNEENVIYIVSASLYFWLKPFSEELNVNLISTKLHYENNIFTGKFDGKNCNGKEKLNRLQKKLDLKIFSEIISFGDSKGDDELFKISTEKHYKPFRKIN